MKQKNFNGISILSIMFLILISITALADTDSEAPVTIGSGYEEAEPGESSAGTQDPIFNEAEDLIGNKNNADIKSNNIQVTVIPDEAILNAEDNYAYVVYIDFDKISGDSMENNSEDYMEGDPGIESERLEVLQKNSYVAEGYVNPGEYLVNVVIPGDYKNMYSYTIDGTDIKEDLFNGQTINYPIINTKNKTYNIVVNIKIKEGYVDYLDSDETLPEVENIKKILSGEYGESKAEEIKKIEESSIETPESQPEQSESMPILALVLIFGPVSTTGLVIYLLYRRANKDD